MSSVKHTSSYAVKDIQQAESGRRKIDWAKAHMPVMARLVEQVKAEQPLRGQRITGCLHVTKETAVLIHALREAGAEVSWSGCNPLSTQDDVAAALAQDGVSIYAWHGMNVSEFYECIDRTLAIKPTLTLDDGADLILRVHREHPELLEFVLGGTEETTTGVQRLRAMAEAGELRYPVLAINDAITKWEFDNVYGTGQSSIDGILRATNVMLAGKNVVVAGYGHCGRGCAIRAQGMGAHVVVTEVCPQAALKAVMDGFRVMSMHEAARIGEIFITATGMQGVIRLEHLENMRNGAIVCNTGHYDCEIEISGLETLVEKRRVLRAHCEELTLKNGRTLYLLAQGRLVNLAAAEGHPSEVMDMSFANQFLGMIYMAKQKKGLNSAVYPIPPENDVKIARIKLETMGITIDTLTAAQQAYTRNYLAGT